MTFKGEASLMGASLELSSQDIEWRISIRRVDDQSDNKFMEYNNKELDAKEIVEFVPNWKTLDWTNIKNSMFSNSESYIKDDVYILNVAENRDSSLSHKNVITEFRKFMKTS